MRKEKKNIYIIRASLLSQLFIIIPTILNSLETRIYLIILHVYQLSKQITHRPQPARTTYILSQLCTTTLHPLSLPHATTSLSHPISPYTTA